MKNKDFLTQQKAEFAKQLKYALDSKDETKITEAFETYANGIQQSLADAATEMSLTADSAILASRGMRQLSSAEQTFYNNIIDVSKSVNPKQAMTGLDVTIPQTVIDSVIADISNSHPLLDAINIQNTYGSVKAIFADDVKQMAAWGTLTSAITEELAGAIHSKEFGTSKLTAFIPVPKDMLDLGASYIDSYVRTILADALSYGLEYGFVCGTGKDEPIGMIKDIDGAVTNGAYADKTAIKLTSLDVSNYMSVVGKLAKKGTDGKTRTVSSVDLIVNPVDYLTKIVPATTVLATDGSYKGNIFPFPTNVYQSEMVEEGTAVMGLLNRYQACMSTGKEGKVDYSDQFQFLEDNRVYMIKSYATGFAKSGNDFLKLDISKLEPLKISVSLESATT